MTDAPSNSASDLEAYLIALWRKMLSRPDLTIDDDFFDSGGDSLLATEMLLQIADRLPKTAEVSALLETGTVRGFVAYLYDGKE